MVAKNLPDLRGMDLSNVDPSDGSQKGQKMSDYMEATFIPSVRKLRRINRHARHFYGIPILNERTKAVGALVLDSHEDEPFEDRVEKVLESHAQALSYTYTTG